MASSLITAEYIKGFSVPGVHWLYPKSYPGHRLHTPAEAVLFLCRPTPAAAEKRYPDHLFLLCGLVQL